MAAALAADAAMTAGQVTAVWTYFSAPVLGMPPAAEATGRTRPRGKDTP